MTDFVQGAMRDLVPGLNPNEPARGRGNWIASPGDPTYDLLFVEFDDQGRPFEADSIDRALGFIHTRAHDADPLIIVFVHGWKHSARNDDDNVTSFTRLLHANAHIEQLRPSIGGPRRVIGVYVGWRGLTLHWLEMLQNLTFFTRSEGALRVALGSVRELFARLHDFRNRHDEQKRPTRSGARLVLAGHSFGGLIVYSAVAEYLIASVSAPTIAAPVAPFGDLVVLINPAFEAARYHPLHSIVARRGFVPKQVPVFLSVTATNDWATGYAFWLGRRVWPYSGASTDQRERDAKLNTMGHLDWMRTHTLTLGTKAPAAVGEAHGSYGKRNLLDDAERANLLAAEDLQFQQFWAQNTDAAGHLRPGWVRTYSYGAVLQEMAPAIARDEASITPDNPFWVVQASPDIIDGHNGIFKTPFLDFLRQVFDDTIRMASPLQAR